MSNELRKSLIVSYAVLIAVALITGIGGYSAHKLDAWTVAELSGFVVVFSTVWTWWSVRDECQTKARAQEVQVDLEEFGMRVVKQSGDVYSVITNDIPGTPIEDNLDLNELEAFASGVAVGWRIWAYSDEQEPTESELENGPIR